MSLWNTFDNSHDYIHNEYIIIIQLIIWPTRYWIIFSTGVYTYGIQFRSLLSLHVSCFAVWKYRFQYTNLGMVVVAMHVVFEKKMVSKNKNVDWIWRSILCITYQAPGSRKPQPMSLATASCSRDGWCSHSRTTYIYSHWHWDNYLIYAIHAMIW